MRVRLLALAAGLIYAGALAVVLPVSKGYLNPALTIMLWVFKKMAGIDLSQLLIVAGMQQLERKFSVSRANPDRNKEKRKRKEARKQRKKNKRR